MISERQERMILEHPRNGKGIGVKINKYKSSAYNSFMGREGSIVHFLTKNGRINKVVVKLYSVGYGKGIVTFPVEYITLTTTPIVYKSYSDWEDRKDVDNDIDMDIDDDDDHLDQYPDEPEEQETE